MILTVGLEQKVNRCWTFNWKITILTIRRRKTIYEKAVGNISTVQAQSSDHDLFPSISLCWNGPSSNNVSFCFRKNKIAINKNDRSTEAENLLLKTDINFLFNLIVSFSICKICKNIRLFKKYKCEWFEKLFKKSTTYALIF